mmetsp:Transcript_33597/g.96388  ORF Transcript_33597/g.96388 Transcript_33597/m.96388 type:complete len:301 (-) Transcript_33597:45-947(-)
MDGHFGGPRLDRGKLGNLGHTSRRLCQELLVGGDVPADATNMGTGLLDDADRRVDEEPRHIVNVVEACHPCDLNDKGPAQHSGLHGLGWPGCQTDLAPHPEDRQRPDSHRRHAVVLPIDPTHAFVAQFEHAIHGPRFVVVALCRQRSAIGVVGRWSKHCCRRCIHHWNRLRLGLGREEPNSLEDVDSSCEIHTHAKCRIGANRGNLYPGQMDDCRGSEVEDSVLHSRGISDVGVEALHPPDLLCAEDLVQNAQVHLHVEERHRGALAKQVPQHIGAEEALAASHEHTFQCRPLGHDLQTD